MSKPTLNKKIRFALILIPFFGMLSNIIVNLPVGFPEESKLHYSTGVFEIEKAMQSTNHVLLRQIDNGHSYQVFSCSYSPFGNQRASSCGDNKYLAPYVSKEVTIGWYNVDRFLGFENDIPQMVTLEVDGEVIRDYNYTSLDVSRNVNSSLFIFIPIMLIMVSLCYWFLGKVH